MAMRRVWVWSNALLYFPVGNPVYGLCILCIFDAKVMLRTSPVVCILLASSVVFSLCSKGDNNVRGALSPGQSGQGCKPILRAGMVLPPHPCTVVPDMPCILSPKHHGQGAAINSDL